MPASGQSPISPLPALGTSNHGERVQRIIADYFLALDDGCAPDRSELLRANPDLKQELMKFFRDQDQVTEFCADTAAGLIESVNLDFPAVFGDYELLGLLGRGGMGAVYRARDLRLGRVVALKMIVAGMRSDVNARARFERERVLSASLDHPNIVSIYEIGEVKGIPYFTMRLIEGPQLTERIPEITRDPRRAARLLSKVARAVQHAHERAVLHRDLKPDNILLDASGEPFVADFGLGKRLAGDSAITESGMFFGAVGYLSPEQAKDPKAPHSVAGDIHGLGLVLYELLAGKKAYECESPTSTAQLIATWDPTPPSRILAGVPVDLETICLKCLEKSPERRYESAQALAEDLERYLAGKPIRVKPVSTLRRAAKWARRRPAAASALTVALVAAVGLIVLSGWYGARLRLAREEAALKKLQTEKLAYLASQFDYSRFVTEAWGHAMRGDYHHARALVREIRENPQILRHAGIDFEIANRVAHPRHISWLNKNTHQGGWAALSPDGQWLVEGGEAEMSIWQRGSNNPGNPREVRWSEGEVVPWSGGMSGTISSDSQLLATVGQYGNLLLFDLPSRTEVKVHESDAIAPGATCVSFAPNDLILAVGESDGSVDLWDARTQQRINRISASSAVTCVAFSGDGKMLAFGTRSGGLHLWPLDPPGERIDLEEKGASILCISVQPSGTLVAAGLANGEVKLWDGGNRQQVDILHEQGDPVHGVAFSPDGRYLASGGEDHQLTIWDMTTRSASQVIHGSVGGVWSVAWSAALPDLVFTDQPEGGVDIWRVGETLRGVDLDEPLQPGPQDSEIVGVGISKDSRSFRAAEKYGTIREWRVGGEDLGVVPAGELKLAGHEILALSPDGDRALVSASGLDLRVISIEPGCRSDGNDEPLPPVKVACRAACFGPECRYLATENSERTIQIYQRMETKKKNDGPVWRRIVEQPDLTPGWWPRWDAVKPQMAALAFSPDGRLFAAAWNHAPTIVIWTLDHPGPPATIGFHSDGISSLAFSPDSKQIVSGGKNACLYFWDVEPRPTPPNAVKPARLQNVLWAHTDSVLAMVFSHDGRKIVSVGADRALLFWGLVEGVPGTVGVSCGGARDLQGRPSVLAIAPNSSFLLAGGRDRYGTGGNLQLWRTQKP